MPAFAISEVAFPCMPPPLLDEAGPKMPQNAGTGEHSVSRGAGTSCRLQPPGHPCSTGGQAHQPGDGTHCVGCFGKRARPRAAVPSKGHMSPGGRGSLRATRMGTAWRKGFLFPLTPHNYPRQPGRLSAPLPGQLQSSGGPCKGGTGYLPPKDTLWRQQVSQPAPWGLSRTLYLLCALNEDECCCGAQGACWRSQKVFCNLSGYK